MPYISRKINIQGTEVNIIYKNSEDYISLTDMAKRFGGEITMYNWLRNRNTIEFLGIWEYLHNINFKPIEFDRFKKQAGLHSFTLSPQRWIRATNAIGLISKAGRFGGGTFAHKDIAFEFGSWLSPEFKLYLIKEFQRLKEQENKKEWSVARVLSKVNYKIHTEAIKTNLIPPKITKDLINFIYADEADILNKALFGLTAKEWQIENPKKKGNIRDYATMEQLVVLANMESINAEYIKSNLSQFERLKKLNDIAIRQLKILLNK